MNPLEVRFEDVSGKASIIVTANLGESWRPLGNHFGFYGFAHEKYLENGLITVRVWVIESPAQSIRAQSGFPLDLQSMGSSPSRALAFRLFNGRLSVGAALGTVINSRRSDGSPGYYKEAVLLAQHAGVSYWLRFYAALNDEHPEIPEWTEQDFPATEEATLPRVADIRELRASNIEDRLSRVSTTLDSLEERAGALVRDFQARPDGSPAAMQENGVNLAEDLEKTARDLREQWSKEIAKQTDAMLGKLREEAANSGRAFEEREQQLASMGESKLASFNQAAANAEASLEAAVENLREEIIVSTLALAESREQLASLAESKPASLSQPAASAVSSLEAAMAKLREEVSNARRELTENQRQLASLAEARLASPNLPAASAVSSLEAAMAKLREEVGDSRRSSAESQQQLTSLIEARLASRNQPESNAVSSLEAAMAKLREEVGDSRRSSAENQQQLTSLIEARLASRNQPEAISVASLEAAVEKLWEEVGDSRRALAEDQQQLASLTEARLASVNRTAANAIANLEAAAAKLREEVGNSRRALAENQQQLASVADAKLASLNEATANAMAGFEGAAAKLREEAGHAERTFAESKRELARLIETGKTLLNQIPSRTVPPYVEPEQRRFRSQYATSPEAYSEAFMPHSAEQSAAFVDHGSPSNRRGAVGMLTLAAGLFLVVTVTPWGAIFSTPEPVQMHLQAQAPSDFADQSPYWSAKHRAKEEETAQAYWQAAASSLQMRYPFGSELPADPAPEFKVDSQYAPTGRAGAVVEMRAHYWEKLRACWSQRRFWIESQPEQESFAVHMRRVWEQIKSKFA